MRRVLMIVVWLLGTIVPAHAQQFITVDFSTGQLWHMYGDNERDVYQVVLPRQSAQAAMAITQPVIGRFTQADYKPTWWPTLNMRRNDPSLPSAVRYGHPRHPIGVYRLRIAWQNPNNPGFWIPVRIHGGAKERDLNQAKSAGCIRMLDVDIERLVANKKRAQAAGQTEVIITFGFLPVPLTFISTIGE